MVATEKREIFPLAWRLDFCAVDPLSADSVAMFERSRSLTLDVGLITLCSILVLGALGRTANYVLF